MTVLNTNQGAGLSPLQCVHFLRGDVGLTEAQMADATGASPRTVRRWTKATDDDLQRGPNYARKIDDLYTVVSDLQDSLTNKGIRQWLTARNRYLKGERPIDLLRNDQFSTVHEAATAFRDGVYV